ncbi:MAG: hypothetical protein Q9209_007958 [Squamulea sp. 1 TL-2023]
MASSNVVDETQSAGDTQPSLSHTACGNEFSSQPRTLSSNNDPGNLIGLSSKETAEEAGRAERGKKHLDRLERRKKKAAKKAQKKEKWALKKKLAEEDKARRPSQSQERKICDNIYEYRSQDSPAESTAPVSTALSVNGSNILPPPLPSRPSQASKRNRAETIVNGSTQWSPIKKKSRLDPIFYPPMDAPPQELGHHFNLTRWGKRRYLGEVFGKWRSYPDIRDIGGRCLYICMPTFRGWKDLQVAEAILHGMPKPSFARPHDSKGWLVYFKNPSDAIHAAAFDFRIDELRYTPQVYLGGGPQIFIANLGLAKNEARLKICTVLSEKLRLGFWMGYSRFRTVVMFIEQSAIHDFLIYMGTTAESKSPYWTEFRPINTERCETCDDPRHLTSDCADIVGYSPPTPIDYLLEPEPRPVIRSGRLVSRPIRFQMSFSPGQGLLKSRGTISRLQK